jgi:hypothetical protein
MTRACASVVEARGSLDAGSPASPFASAAASCGAFLAARSASLRAGSCCLACSSSVTASAAPTRRSRSSAARRRAALACGWRRRDRYQVACADRANRSLGNPPPTRSGAACSGKKSNGPSSSPDARSGRKTALMPSADFRSAIRTASRRSQSLPRQQPGVAVSSRSPRPAGFMRPDRHALSRKMRLSRRRRSDGAQPKIALPVARARKAISNRLPGWGQAKAALISQVVNASDPRT